jgi:hypothetical protein
LVDRECTQGGGKKLGYQYNVVKFKFMEIKLCKLQQQKLEMSNFLPHFAGAQISCKLVADQIYMGGWPIYIRL